MQLGKTCQGAVIAELEWKIVVLSAQRSGFRHREFPRPKPLPSAALGCRSCLRSTDIARTRPSLCFALFHQLSLVQRRILHVVCKWLLQYIRAILS